MHEILNEIQALYFQKLEAKTGWGRNDLKELYKDCVLEVLKNHIKL
jgi:hypothetical protein